MSSSPWLLFLESNPDLAWLYVNAIRHYCRLDAIALESTDQILSTGRRPLSSFLAAFLNLDVSESDQGGLRSAEALRAQGYEGRIFLITSKLMPDRLVIDSTGERLPVLPKEISLQELAILTQSSEQQ